MWVAPMNDAEAAKIESKSIADAALAKFKLSHSDFDEVFPVGINLNCHDGITHADVMHVLSKAYTDQKAKNKRRVANAAEREALQAECQKHRDQYDGMIAQGWRPPQPQEEVTARRHIVRQPDGSVIVEDLD